MRFVSVFLFFGGCSMATTRTAQDEIGLTYSIKRGTEYTPLNVRFQGGKLVLDPADPQLRFPVSVLPLRLSPEQRKVGHVLYDDGRGPRTDTSRKVFVLSDDSTWRSFTTLIAHFQHQGMQPQDAWRMKAHYDQASGFLVSATIAMRVLDRWSCNFELILQDSTDPEIHRKAYVPEPKPPTRLVVSHSGEAAGTIRFDANRGALDAETSEAGARLKRDWEEISGRSELTLKVCERRVVDGDEVLAMVGRAVRPGDADYIHAVRDALDRAGYEVSIED